MLMIVLEDNSTFHFSLNLQHSVTFSTRRRGNEKRNKSTFSNLFDCDTNDLHTHLGYVVGILSRPKSNTYSFQVQTTL